MFTEKFITPLQQVFENPTSNLSALCKSCVKIAFCSSELLFKFLYTGSSIRNARERFVSRIHLCFVNLAIRPTAQISI